MQSRLDRIEIAAARDMNRGTGILATIGSTAPFIGLFGTVWGIMNSFVGISQAQTTNLAVVAPGIAEALLATAFGLVAAIPAVFIYNLFARSLASYKALVGDACCRGDAPRLARSRSRYCQPMACTQSRGVSDGGAIRKRRRRRRRNPRDQRHTVHRRDARAADHLHGGRAALDRERSRRPSRLDGQACNLARTSRSFSPIKSDLSLMLGNDQISAVTLAPTLDQATLSDHDKRLFLRADKSVPYGELMRVMNLLRAAGYLKVALVGLEGAPPRAPAAPHGNP